MRTQAYALNSVLGDHTDNDDEISRTLQRSTNRRGLPSFYPDGAAAPAYSDPPGSPIPGIYDVEGGEEFAAALSERGPGP